MCNLLASIIVLILAIAVPKLNAEEPLPANNPPSPPWTRDLVICEIATKGFTSPNGPESGTFASAQEKVPYLKALGINGIRLTGHSLSDPKHFYNIWTQYACIDPFKIDPTLGTPAEFKSFITQARACI